MNQRRKCRATGCPVAAPLGRDGWCGKHGRVVVPGVVTGQLDAHDAHDLTRRGDCPFCFAKVTAQPQLCGCGAVIEGGKAYPGQAWRFFLVYDGRAAGGDTDRAAVLESLGPHPTAASAFRDARECWDDHDAILFSYRRAEIAVPVHGGHRRELTDERMEGRVLSQAQLNAKRKPLDKLVNVVQNGRKERKPR